MMRSPLFAAIVAIILSAATCGGVLLLRFHQILASAEKTPPAAKESTLLTPRQRGWDFWSNQIEALTNQLRDERAALDKRGKDLDALALRLNSEKAELVRARTEVEGIQKVITDQIPVLKASEKTNLKSLSRSYATMRPQQAVTILTEMDDATSVKILAMMKPDIVGAILQEMAKPGPSSAGLANRAAKISDQLRLLKQDPITP